MADVAQTRILVGLSVLLNVVALVRLLFVDWRHFIVDLVTGVDDVAHLALVKSVVLLTASVVRFRLLSAAGLIFF